MLLANPDTALRWAHRAPLACSQGPRSGATPERQAKENAKWMRKREIFFSREESVSAKEKKSQFKFTAFSIFESFCSYGDHYKRLSEKRTYYGQRRAICVLF